MPHIARFAIALAPLIVTTIWVGDVPLQAYQATEEEISYTDEIEFLVSNYCATCHHGKNPEGDFVLDTYDDVRRQLEKGELLERINDELDPMPPAGRMSERQRGLFQAWADGGYVNKGDGSGVQVFEPFLPPVITPIDIRKRGFELLEKLQGHWVGSMNLMGQDIPWFAWDFRAIAPSHVHGIFEGGTLGNLFTSFFVADFKGTPTIMARNGGLLNGIYRTSYFILDSIEKDGESTEYRLIDAYGGSGIMWMSLKFSDNQLAFNAQTSRLGLTDSPKQHMRFTGNRMHPKLALDAAKAVGFPNKNKVEREFPDGLTLPDWGPGIPVTSYSYIWEDDTLSVDQLAKVSGDPYRIDQIPHLARLRVSFKRKPPIKNVNINVYLSNSPLTDKEGKLLVQYGFVRKDAFDSILMFSELTAGEEEMTFTYLHPGTYYLTIVADLNADGYVSLGDITHPSQQIVVLPKKTMEVQVPNISVPN